MVQCPYKPVCPYRDREEPCNSKAYTFCDCLREYLSTTGSSRIQDSQPSGEIQGIILPKHRLDSWDFLRE